MLIFGNADVRIYKLGQKRH